MIIIKSNLSIVTGLKGVNYIASLVNNNSDIFQKNDAENDIGFDGYVEFRNENESANYTIACQIKTGESHFRNGNVYVQSDYNHFKYWSEHNLYSFMFVYNDIRNKCYWIDLSKFTKNHNLEEKFIVKCSNMNELNENTYTAFKGYALSTKESDINKLKLLKVAEEILDVTNDSLSDETIKSLVNNRNSKLVWSIVLQKFLTSYNISLCIDLIYFMSWTTRNPDIFWTKNNNIEAEYKLEFYKFITAIDKDLFIEKIINVSTSDKVEFARGEAGQAIYHIIEKIDGYEESLIRLIESKLLESEVRTNALFFLFLYKDKYFIKEHYRLLSLLKEDNALTSEEFTRFNDHLINYGGFYF